MTEAIRPPLASRPNEACALVCDAPSNGDLAAAASRLLFTVQVRQTLVADDIALVNGGWAGGEPVSLSGRHWSVVRRPATVTGAPPSRRSSPTTPEKPE